MKSSWQIKKLGSVSQVITRGISPTYISENGITILNQKCIRNHGIDFSLSRLHDQRSKKISEEKFLQLGDVLVNSTGTGTLGRVAQVKTLPAATTVDSHVSIVRPLKNMFYRDFFGYMLVAIEDEIKLSGEGASGQTELSRQTLKDKFYVSYPESILEQERIVKILDEAFEKIEKVKRGTEKNFQNSRELFESYLQGVFKRKGAGWEELTVKDCVEKGIIYKPLDGNHGELHPTKSDFVSSGIPFIMSRDMKNGGIDEVGCSFITEKQAKTLRTGFAKDGDVLLSHKGTIGEVSILNTDREFIVLTPQITYYRIKNKEKLFKEYLYYYFLNSDFQKEINSIAQGGSTRAYIGITKQLELKLVIAPLKEQQTIVRQLDALRAETQKLEAVYQKKIADLEELKKSILQKAFAGELGN